MNIPSSFDYRELVLQALCRFTCFPCFLCYAMLREKLVGVKDHLERDE